MPYHNKQPAYNPDQIRAYLQRLSPSSNLTWLLDSPREPQDDLHHLSVLQKLQLAAVPFENLGLHYSAQRNISLDVDDLYEKIVTRRRGGYCMENNGFFDAVLRGLGFTVYGAGARVSDAMNGGSGGGYSGWSHMVNIVTLSDGIKYMIDVGFGANGPTQPLPLETGRIWKGISPQEMRLVYENIPTNSDPGQKLWIYQYRDLPAEEWVSAYCFTELEFLLKDFEVMNFWTSHNPDSWFLKTVVVVRMIMKDDELIGIVILSNGEVKFRCGGETKVVVKCKTEDDRLRALHSWFGIELGEVERRGIRGLVSELNRHV